MNVRLLLKKGMLGILAAFVAAALFGWFLVLRFPVDQVALAALPQVEARSGLRLQYGEVRSTLGGVAFSRFQIAGETAPLVTFRSLELGIDPLSVLTARPRLSVEGDLPGRGSVRGGGRFSFGTVELNLETKRYPLDAVNAPLQKWGARVTAALDLGLQVAFPVDAPEKVTGEVSLLIQPLQIFGGPMAAGFGLAKVDIVKVRGSGKIRNGVIDGLKLLVDGDDLWGTVALTLRLRKPFGASSYLIEPRFKVKKEIADKLVPVLPMTGLATDSQGYYSRKYRGTFSRL